MPDRFSHLQSREWRLLCAILGADWSANTSHYWNQDLFVGIDWAKIPNLSWQHKIRPMVAATLREAGWPQPASATRAIIEAAEQQCAGKAVCQLDLLGRLTKAAEQLGLRVIALKGVALSLHLYGDPFIREAFDLDFLVHPLDFAQFREVVRACGCISLTPELTLSPRQTAILSGFSHHEQFMQTASGTVIECHYQLETNPHLLRTDHDMLWCRRTLVPLADSNVAILGRDDLIHYLGIHASRHGWERLKWLADLAAILRTTEEAELLRQRDRAANEGHLMMFDSWLLLARNIAGVAVPPAALEPASCNEDARNLAERALRLTAMDKTPAGIRRHSMALRNAAFRLGLKHSARYIAFEVATLFHRDRDWFALRLPDRFIWLYYVYWPFGYIGRRLKRNFGLILTRGQSL